MRRWMVGLLLALAAPAPVALAETMGEGAFVIVYRCDGGRFLAVGYPAFRDARTARIRLSWDGRTRLLSPARAASGAPIFVAGRILPSFRPRHGRSESFRPLRETGPSSRNWRLKFPVRGTGSPIS